MRTLQKHWPKTEISWIIGKTEYQLVKDIENINFIIFDKAAGISAYFELSKNIKKQLDNKPFDVLLHMQLSLRASLASLFIPATIKLGFDKKRAKDLQSLFCNQQIIPDSTRQHVLDSFLEFPRHFQLEPLLSWQLPVSETAIESIKTRLGCDRKLFVINPCAVAKAKNWRNWNAQGYAAIADYVDETYDMQVVLTGGSSSIEKTMADEILQLCSKSAPINLVASTSIDELVACLKLAEVVLAPDTGPVHIASALKTKTIGLYAATNPERAGPYNFKEYVVSKYPEALLKYNNKSVDDAAWGERIKTDKSMQLISVNDVCHQIDRIL